MGAVEVVFFSALGTLGAGGLVFLIGRALDIRQRRDEDRAERYVARYLDWYFRGIARQGVEPPPPPPLPADLSIAYRDIVPSNRLPGPARPRISELRRLLTDRLSTDDVRKMVFDLELIEVDENASKSAQITALMAELRNYKRLGDLRDWIKENRSDIEPDAEKLWQ